MTTQTAAAALAFILRSMDANLTTRERCKIIRETLPLDGEICALADELAEGIASADDGEMIPEDQISSRDLDALFEAGIIGEPLTYGFWVRLSVSVYL